MNTFTLKSLDLGGQMTEKHFSNAWGSTGENVSPQLSWENPPKDTKSFAITMYDPAAPTGSGWWHWVIFNIPAEVSTLPSGASNGKNAALPAGSTDSLSDFMKPGYSGPIPAPGTGFHPYIVTVHALSEVLTLSADTHPAMVGFTMAPLTLGKASIIAYLKV